MSEDILNGVPGFVFDAIRAEFAARNDQIDALRGEVLRVRIERDTIGTFLSAARGELSILEADVRGLRDEVERLTAELKAAREALVFAAEHMPEFGDVSGYEYDLACDVCGAEYSVFDQMRTTVEKPTHTPDCELAKWFAFVKTLEPRP